MADEQTPRPGGPGEGSIDPADLTPAAEEDSGRPEFSRRTASVQLRQGAAEPGQDMMDPAHQSLADALRITLRLVQLGMVVLAVLFLFSGAKTINEGETGLKLRFGRVVASELAPGFEWSWPYPIGDLIKIDTGSRRISLDSQFWPFLRPQERERPIEELGGRTELDPARDGSLITADGNLVHVQARVNYRRSRERVNEFAQTIHPGAERSIVEAAAMRGLLHAVSEVTVDELLTGSGSDAGSVASRAERLAQQMLDEMGSGLLIEDLMITEKIPPLFARERFLAVQSAESQAQREIETARQQAETQLSEAAGASHPRLRELIDRYEEAVDAHEAARLDGDESRISTWAQTRDQVMDEIRTVLDSDRVGGEAARLVYDARSYVAEESNRRLSDVRRFRAKQEQFARNPTVTLFADWADAWTVFVSREEVELVYQPVDAELVDIAINRDPEIMRRQEGALKRQRAEETRRRREAQHRASEFRTQTDIIEADGG